MFGNIMLAISTVAGIVAAVYVVLAYHRPKGQPMVKPQDQLARGTIPYFSNRRLVIPIFAAAIAWGSVAFDVYDRRYFPNPYTSTIYDNVVYRLTGKPLGWALESIFPSSNVLNQTANLDTITVWGGNVGDIEIKLDDVYLLSNTTGARLNLYINDAGTPLYPKNFNPIPPRAIFMLWSDKISPPKGSSQKDFLQNWGSFYLIAEYDGEKHRYLFQKETVINALPKDIPIGPHVTRKPN
jgi:hypothetical protein